MKENPVMLVTGASGFLGTHLVRALSKAGHSVRALYHNNKPEGGLLQLPGVQWMQCDLLDVFAIREALEGITHICHCAAKVSFAHSDKQRMIRDNADTTANLVNVALEFPGIRMLHVSSIATLGRGNLDHPLSETDVWEESKNNTAYARSKFLSEMEVWRGIEEGLDAVMVNPSIILGAGDWDKGSARLLKIADSEFPYYTEGINGWVDVQDVVAAIILLLQSKVSAERFILSEGNHSYREIFTLMANALGKRPPHKEAPELATKIIAGWNELRSRLTGKTVTITRETARTARTRCFYNNAKFLTAFPEFRYTPIHETIGRMADAYRQQLDA
ncbi:NAD-dependent epimerase/dehydratase family protein [Rurimicrobium arvi]|uniref:NAD-dependent epimerase/dehydratase family protein n=1 Tax=Rurimicrobium arvi TaxID=2049916 RepID=A0ABP8N2K0_9BACT